MKRLHGLRHGYAATLACVAIVTSWALGESAIAEEGLDVSSNAVVTRVGGDVEYLASDELGGRRVGTPEIEIAAEFVADDFRRVGLVPGGEDGTFFQTFEVSGVGEVDTENTSLVLTMPDGSEKALKLGADFQAQLVGGSGSVASELVFVGYGIPAPEYSYDEYEGIDVKDKIVVVIRREPQQNDEDSVFEGKGMTQYAAIRRKLQSAKAKGAAAVLLVNDVVTVPSSDEDRLADSDMFGLQASMLPFAQLTQAVVNDLLAAAPVKSAEGDEFTTLAEVSKYIDENLDPISQPLVGIKAALEIEVDRSTTRNVIGVIEGEGPHADETIIIGAHYDHLGMGYYGSRAGRFEIHNGADDNATGTAAIMELARRFADADQKPGRRLVFIAFTAEEMGLLGAIHYCDQPTIELEKIVAMVNFDMIGWLRNDSLQVYNSNSSADFQPLFTEAVGDTGLVPQLLKGGGGSDQLPFIRKNIPAVFFHTGLTDTYHTPEDDYATLDIEGAARVIDYSENFVRLLAEAEKAPEFGSGRRAQPTTAYLGARTELVDEVQGMFVTEVVEGSPAEKAGLKTGDVLQAIGDDETLSIESLRAVLGKLKPGDDGKLIVLRDGEEVQLDVEFGEVPR